MKLQVDAYCWCQSKEVSIPVAWVRAGQTASCDKTTCGPNCLQINEPEDEQPEHRRRVYPMSKFKPGTYDPAFDSSSGIRPQPKAVLLINVQGLCKCGCEEPVEPGILFRMGHDARLKGILIRAEVTGCEIRLIDPETGVQAVHSPTEYATEFSTGKCDWPTLVHQSALKYQARDQARRSA